MSVDELNEHESGHGRLEGKGDHQHVCHERPVQVGEHLVNYPVVRLVAREMPTKLNVSLKGNSVFERVTQNMIVQKMVVV